MSDDGWTDILKIEPDAVARAQDSSGMLSCFTVRPSYHEVAGKWIVPSGHKKVCLGVVATPANFEAAATLELRPDAALPEAETVMASRDNLPKEAAALHDTRTAAQIVEADDDKYTPNADPESLVKPARAVVEERKPSIQVLAELVSAVAEQLPKTKLAKVQLQLEQLKKHFQL